MPHRTWRCPRAKSACGSSTTLHDFSSRWRPGPACWCSSTTFTGPIRARCRFCTTCCAIFATIACSSSPAIARSSWIARIRWHRRSSTGTASAWRCACRSDVCLAPTRRTLIATLFGVDRVSDELVDALYRETEGNPFFIEEVIKSLIEQGEIYREGETWGRKKTEELSIPAKREGGDRAPAHAPGRADRGCVADGRCARQAFPVRRAVRRVGGERRRAARRARRSQRSPARSRDQRRRARRFRHRRRRSHSRTTRSARCSTRN